MGISLSSIIPPKWKHADSRVRHAAVDKISNQAVLIELARTDPSSDVRRAAARKVTDPSVLIEIVRTDDDYDVCRVAIESLSDPMGLAEIAQKNETAKIREAAVKKIADEEVLRKVAASDSKAYVRMAAVEKIDDHSTLALIAENDKDDEVRGIALARLFGVRGAELASSHLKLFRTSIRVDDDSYVLEGDWVKSTFAEASVVIEKHGDVKAILERKDHQERWILAYMNHPDPQMLVQVLRYASPIHQHHLLVQYAGLVTHGRPEIERTAINEFWTSVDEAGYPVFFTVLGSGGILPSGISPCWARWAVLRILAACPAICPPAKRDAFAEVAKKYFGAGILAGNERSPKGSESP